MRESRASSRPQCRCASPVANNTLFGTDGVRGTAGRYPLDPPTVRRLGAALVRSAFAKASARQGTSRDMKILVGRDTPESGACIEAELAHGASGEGASVTSVSVVPTPAVQYLTRAHGYDAGAVISASHNPFEDNGIKVFSGKGEKFTERVEREGEAIVADLSWIVPAGAPAPLMPETLVGSYLDHLATVFPEAAVANGFKLAVGRANGATTPVARALFERLGFETIVIADPPRAPNVN